MPVKRAVITVPQYFWKKNLHPLLCSAIEAAEMADIEIIDVIEETHADLLYYMSNEKYSEKIKPGMKIAIFDIGGGTCVCKVYEVSEYEGKLYATCFIESNSSEGMSDIYSGRSIDEVIIKKLEELVPENLRSNVKLKILEEARKIKHNLSLEEENE